MSVFVTLGVFLLIVHVFVTDTCTHLSFDVCVVADTGSLLFVSGMAINIHSDHILRSLCHQSDATDMSYRIPRGISMCPP